MNTQCVNIINDNDEDDDEKLDIDWINEFKSNEDKYNDFYKEPVNSVIVYLLYVNKENEVQHIHKDRCLINNNNGMLNREIIISFIKRYHQLFSVNYKLFSILKYNIDLEPSEIQDFSIKENTNKYESRFLKSEKYLDDIYFKETIHMFQDLNALFFIFVENTANHANHANEANQANQANANTSIKRIKITNTTKRNKPNNNKAQKNKTKRTYYAINKNL